MKTLSSSRMIGWSVPALAAAVASIVACGSLTDPTKGEPRIATVSGALTGESVPDGAHVAVVWKAGAEKKWAVGDDAPVTGGRFTIDLTAPAPSYFVPAEGDYDAFSGGGGSWSSEYADPPSVTVTPDGGGVPSAGTSGSGAGQKGFAVGSRIGTQDALSGQITQPLEVAVAGLVVYVDANGNGKLDIEGGVASSPDTILGGNRELLLAYFRDGGTLDYEKLRDRSGILPHEGYNLAWTEGRWLPLDAVQLQITSSTRLPTPVCSGDGDGDNVAPTTSRGGWNGTPGTGPYPPPGTPGVKCAPDGRSFTYAAPCGPTATPAPPPTGLCSLAVQKTPSGTACLPPSTSALPSGAPAPAGWPCVGAGADAGADSIVRVVCYENGEVATAACPVGKPWCGSKEKRIGCTDGKLYERRCGSKGPVGSEPVECACTCAVNGVTSGPTCSYEPVLCQSTGGATAPFCATDCGFPSYVPLEASMRPCGGDGDCIAALPYCRNDHCQREP